MSSIYKKGRDGYYYYQTYVYNKDSKKKDKRIFHALGTKSLSEAKIKQSEFDLRYEKQYYAITESLNLKKYLLLKKNPILVFLIMITIIIYLSNSLYDNRKMSTKSHNKSNLSLIEPLNNLSLQTVSEKANKIDSLKQKEFELSNIIPEENLIAQKTTTPKYNIIRVDRLSGIFEQGRLYVTINQNVDKNSQRILCKSLMEQYNEFTNIIICLYADNNMGRELARGNDEAVSIEEKKRSWLAMYTFNSVEGEYFDENPSDYLGNY